MLETAKAKVLSNRFKNVILKRALADDFSHEETFGLPEKFDTVFFSYSLSMIPTWRESIENALENLRPGQRLFIVDFYDQHQLPHWFSWILKKWLSLFHVKYPADLIPFLQKLEKEGKGSLQITPLFRSYSFIAEFESGLRKG
jgi:S-adenosylmethionine-diacylgycerolhomoserine-N-methlytransferase